jgi:hypothetical protein
MRRLAISLLAAWAIATPASARVSVIAEGWHEYSPRERYEALRNYRQHEALPNERRENIERNYERWRNMPEPEREHMRQNYERYRQLPPEQRNRLRERYRSRPEQ